MEALATTSLTTLLDEALKDVITAPVVGSRATTRLRVTPFTLVKLPAA